MIWVLLSLNDGSARVCVCYWISRSRNIRLLLYTCSVLLLPLSLYLTLSLDLTLAVPLRLFLCLGLFLYLSLALYLSLS